MELGCGLGYSAIWIARALPRGGRLDTIELDPLHASRASENFEAAKVQHKIRILEGEARSILPGLKGPYDFIFEDATYGKKPDHYEDLLRVLRIGGLLQFSNWFPIEPAIIGGQSLRRWKREFAPWSYAPTGTLRFVKEALQDKRLSAVLLPYLWRGIATKVKG